MSDVCITVYITRDSDSEGVLSPTVDVWLTPPTRYKLTDDAGHVWCPSTARTAAEINEQLATLRLSLPCTYARQRFGMIPDNDDDVITCLMAPGL